MANPTDDTRSQADKFRHLARELECDEDEARFKAAVRKVGTAPREPTKKADKPVDE
jgi:hypothetical protein